jgi:hypothetical protein
MFVRKTIRFNYTTYDVRRDQDSLSSRTQSDLMVLSNSEDEEEKLLHPYWFGRIISIFSVRVLIDDEDINAVNTVRTFDVLIVRWFGNSIDGDCGVHTGLMPRIGFLPAEDKNAFGFVNPDDVIRSVHLIPAMGWGQTDEYMGSSIARTWEEKDWLYYYVNL